MILLNWHFNGENHDKPLDLGVPSVTKCCIYLLQLVDLFASATKNCRQTTTATSSQTRGTRVRKTV